MSKKTEKRTHPSYGMISIGRWNGSRQRLFGSSLSYHQSTIRLEIAPGHWEHDLHEDRYYTDGTATLIEVEMSAAQFAEMITSTNIGGGVPCTIRRLNRERMENPPEIETEVERIKSTFKSDLQGMIAKMGEYRKTIEKATSKLSDKAREEIRIALDVITQQLSANVPFIADQFDEAAGRVVTAAKAEIEAFAMHALKTVGLQAIAEGQAPRLLAASVDGKLPETKP